MKDVNFDTNAKISDKNRVSTVYICTNVLVDYTLYLKKCLEYAGYNAEMVALMNEHQYRVASKSKGLKKIWLRFFMYVLYPLKLALKVLSSSPNAVFVVTSNTFYAPAIACCCSLFNKCKIVNLVYDLFPDALEVAGIIKSNSFLSILVGAISKFNRSASDCSVYLGEFLRKYSEIRWGRFGTVESIDISADVSQYLSNQEFDGGIIRIHYGGQLGYMHDADSIIASVLSVIKDDSLCKKIDFSFRVSGAQAKRIELAFAGLPIQVLPPLPSQEWREEIRKYHIGLVTLSPGGATVCLPSKSYGMMAGGLPIIAVCPLWSDLAKMILLANAGWIVSNSPYESSDELIESDYQSRCMQKLPISEIKRQFVILLKHIADNPKELLEKRTGALNAMNTIYGTQEIGMRWKSVIG